MNVLIVGKSKAGSWAMRGVQLGAAIGARVVEIPTEADVRWADRVVLVKRAGPQWASLVHRLDRPLVWDVLDCWRQPADNGRTETSARQWLEQQIGLVRPDLILAATQAMADACDGVYLPHHTWDGLAPTPARNRVQVIAYQGGEVFLGRWRPALESICLKYGWQFQINPPSLAAADLIVAFRDGPWDGWMCREWKSGVKVGNAIAAGRPFISQASAAVRELQPAGSVVETVEALERVCLSWAGDYEGRQAVAMHARALAPALTLASVAARYQRILDTMAVESAVA